MDQLDDYRKIIKRLLREREACAQASRALAPDLESVCMFDDTSGQYALMAVGWQLGLRVSGPTLLLRIKDGKIWVEDDATDAPIADDLVDAGVPREDIVLGFHRPEVRAETGFAVA